MKNKDMKWLALIAIAALVLLYLGGYLNAWLPSNVDAPNPSPSAGGQQVIDPNAVVSVTKPLKIVVLDEHGGAAATGTTNAIDIYGSNGESTVETDLDLSSGSVTTSNSYTSDTSLWIAYYYDTTIDEYMWWNVVVPKMTPGDADSLTTNTLTVYAFSTPAATDIMTSGAGATYADAADLNVTGTSNDTGTFTYSWFITGDNTGFLSSVDPVYDVNNKAIVWATLTGSGYETVSLSGFDGSFTLGSTKYYYHTLDDSDVSKWKVGNSYKSGFEGAGSFSFSYTATGYTANATVLNMYCQLYSDIPYMQNNGAYGPYSGELCESTVEFFQLS